MYEFIDRTRLTLDYKEGTTYPRGFRIPKQDLLYLYIELNLTVPEICVFSYISRSVVYDSLAFHSITKDAVLRKEAVKQSSLRKYGVAYASQASWFRERVKTTVLHKYGVDNISKAGSIKKKKEQTCLRNFGVKNPSQSSIVKKTKEQTCLKHYGELSHMKNRQFLQEYVKDVFAKYGGVYPAQAHILHKDIWVDDSKFSKLVKSGVSGDCLVKYTVKDLSVFFNVARSTMEHRIGELDLWDFVDTKVSTYEIELCDLLVSWGLQPIKYRENGLEIDVYSAKHKIGIEFNGNYWHSNAKKQNKYYHLLKTEKAAERGIFIYHLFEYEWVLYREKVINQLKNLFKINTTTIYARKCILREVPNKEAQDFQEQNHLRGSASASVRLGLYYNNELVSLMTFGKPRFNKNVEWELVRFCSKAGTNVVGGASKLFKYFTKTYNPKSIVSYSEIAKTTGKLYSLLGFTIVDITKPNYVWVKNRSDVLSRYMTQKHKLIALGFGTKSETEISIMTRRGYNQLFDCGNRVHIWK